jgi:hypothetical protein
MLLGRSEDAARSIAWFERAIVERPGQGMTESHAFVLTVVGQTARAEAAARDGLQLYPNSSVMWWISAEGYARDGKEAEAEQAYDESLRTGAARDARWRGVQMRGSARATARRSPRKSIESLIRALLTDGLAGQSQSLLDDVRQHYARADIAAVMEQLQLEGQELETIRQLFANVGATTSTDFDVLAAHLEQFVSLCREHGAEPVLLTYPFPALEMRAIQLGVAEATGARIVPLWDRFEVALKTRSREELFVPDGHCTDVGYALLAEIAADTLAGSMKSKR